MNNLFVDARIGKKNIIFGALLFLLFGVVMGIPLTINLFGGSALTAEQYALWKVIHAYGLFLGVINFVLGIAVDRLSISDRQQEIVSWSFIVAGLFGAFGRMALVLLGSYEAGHLLASLGEAAFFTIGLVVFVYGWGKKAAITTAEAEPEGFGLGLGKKA